MRAERQFIGPHAVRNTCTENRYLRYIYAVQEARPLVQGTQNADFSCLIPAESRGMHEGRQREGSSQLFA